MKKVFIAFGIAGFMYAVGINDTIIHKSSDIYSNFTTNASEYQALDIAKREVDLQAHATHTALDLRSREIELEIKEFEAQNKAIMSEFETTQALKRGETLHRVVVFAQGSMFLTIGLAPVGALCWAFWSVERKARHEDEDRRLIKIDSGHFPVNRAWLEGNPDKMVELVTQKVIDNGYAKRAHAAKVDLPNLHTWHNHNQPTVTNTTSHNGIQGTTNPKQAGDVAKAIIEALGHQGLSVSAKTLSEGPQCRSYAIKPLNSEKGKRATVSQIQKHDNDIALYLGVESVIIRQGKGCLICEVARDDREFVQLADILNANSWASAGKAFSLPIALGKDTANNVIIVDLAKLPHLLIGGATGMGKSVALRGIIHCLDQGENVSMILVDPKRVEFAPFEGLKNVRSVVDENEDIEAELAKLVELVETRGKIFKAAGVVNISEYNKLDNDEMGYIVLIVDEMVDLFATSETAQDMIASLCRKARSCGIHLVLATQRPDAKTVSPQIRANVPAKMGLRVSSVGDSITILGQKGAEKLLNRGDSLYHDAETRTMRIQSAYSDVKIAHSVKNKAVSEADNRRTIGGYSADNGGQCTDVKADNDEVVNDRPVAQSEAKTDKEGLRSPETQATIKGMIEDGMTNVEVTKTLTGKKSGRQYRRVMDEVKAQRALIDAL